MNPSEKAPVPYRRGDLQFLLTDPEVAKALPAPDRERLAKVLDLMGARDGSVSRALVEQTLFPEKKGEQAGNTLSAFTSRFNKASTSLPADRRIRIEATRTGGDRMLLFMGPDSLSARISEKMSSEVVATEETTLKNTALPLDTSEISETARKPVFLIAISAAEDEALIRDLLDRLRDHWDSSPQFFYESWDRTEILTGESPDAEYDKAARVAHFALCFLSPKFFRDESSRARALEFQKRRGIIPISLKKVSPDRVEPFKSSIFCGENGAFSDCLTDSEKDAFALELYSKIEARCSKRLARQEALLLQMAVDHVENPEHSHVREVSLNARDAIIEETESSVEDPIAIELLEEWVCDTDPHSQPFAAVLGEFGMGKTTTLKYLTRQLIENRKNDPSVPQPIYFDLRDLNLDLTSSIPGIDECLDDMISRIAVGTEQPFTVQDVRNLVENEGAVIIFDGLDEKLVHLSTDQGRLLLEELWKVLPAKTREARAELMESGAVPGKMILSCRSHFFRTLSEQASALTAQKHEIVGARDYKTLIILPFSDQQIRAYLATKVGEDRVDDVIRLIGSIHNLTDLSPRPFFLSLISDQIGRLEKQLADNQPVRGVTLYDNIIEDSLDRDEGKHRLLREHKPLLMERAAAALWTSGRRRWSWEELFWWLRATIRADEDLDSTYRDTTVEILGEDFRTATMIVRPDGADDRFHFAHTSLQEYFLAGHLVRSLLEGTASEIWAEAVIGMREVESGEIIKCGEILPSVETMEFVGQKLSLLAGVQRERALAEFATLLESGKADGCRLLAFRFLLLAHRDRYPYRRPKAIDLSGLNLSRLQIAGQAERSLDLRNSDFGESSIEETAFRYVNLDGSQFLNTAANRATWRFVSMVGTDFSGSSLVGSRFRDCELSASNFSGVQARNCHVVDSPLDRATGTESLYLEGAVLEQSEIDEQPSEMILSDQSGHSNLVSSCAVVSEGRILSGSHDETLKLWNTETGECLQTFLGHSSWVTSCAVVSKGRILSGSHDETLKLWDTGTGDCLQTFSGHSSSVTSCAAVSEGRILSGSYDTTLKLWDTETGECLQTFSGHSSSATTCAVVSEGRILSGSYDKTLKLWDTETGECLQTFSGHSDRVTTCAMVSEGRILSGSYDTMLKLWDTETGECLQTFTGHSSWVSSCAEVSEGRILSGSHDRTLKLWDTETGDCLQTFTGHSNWFSSCAVVSEGRILSGSGDKTLKLWDTETGGCLQTFTGHSNWVSSCAEVSEGRILSGSGDKTLKLWDTETGECLQTFTGHSDWVFSCAVVSEGRILSGSDDKTLKLWDTETGECLQTFSGHSDWVSSCAVVSEGRILSGSYDKTLKLWDTETGECLQTFTGHSNWVLSSAVVSEGRILSGSGDETLKLWDTETGECLQTFTGHSSSVNSCVVVSEGRILSGSEDNTLKLWDTETGDCLQTFSGHSSRVSSCAVVSEGRILSGSGDKTLKLWDTETGDCLQTFVNGPDLQTWSFDRKNRLISHSKEAHQHLLWVAHEAQTDQFRTYPLEAVPLQGRQKLKETTFK